SLATQVDTEMKGCQLHRATRALTSFILEDLSRWYVQLIRERMWLEGESESKVFAYEAMYYVMRRLMGLMAPFTPHLAEEIYQNLRREKDPDSVHMLDWFAGDAALGNAELEVAMETVRSFDEAVANARQAGKRKLRWPVAEVVVVTGSDTVKDAIERLNSVCMDRANARKVSVVMGRWERIGWIAKPVMKALGKGFGKDSFRVKGLIEAEDGNRLKAKIDLGQTVKLGSGIKIGADYITDARENFSPATGDAVFEIGREHVTFAEKMPENVFCAPMQDAMVYVDIHLTPELESEGYAREVIRRIQEMRRQLDLAVEDFITADVIVNDPRVCTLVSDNQKPVIADEVRARRLTIRAAEEPGAGIPCHLQKDWDVEGVQMTIGISRASD
ncbi:MAG: class I tRNA ligase family protein, partial [Methanoregulaceae archaeon]|nr:class I tRNA ligase family protein [Methanoregulaceae archaeon]